MDWRMHSHTKVKPLLAIFRREAELQIDQRQQTRTNESITGGRERE